MLTATANGDGSLCCGDLKSEWEVGTRVVEIIASVSGLERVRGRRGTRPIHSNY